MLEVVNPKDLSRLFVCSCRKHIHVAIKRAHAQNAKDNARYAESILEQRIRRAKELVAEQEGFEWMKEEPS